MADSTQKRMITEKEIEQIEKMSGLGITLAQCAAIIGVSKKTIERRVKDQPELAVAIEKGKALALSEVAKTAYQLATSGKCYPMTMFFLKCRGGWSETDAVDENQNKYKAPTSLTRVA